MSDVFERLKTLQEVLKEKYELQAKIEEAPKKLSSQEELLSRLKKEFIENNATYEDVRKKISKLKVELADVVAAREKSEKSMDSITSHREYEALDKEIKDANEKEQTIRKDLQKEEKSLAELDNNLKNDESLIERQEKELNEGKVALQNDIDEFKSRLVELENQETDLVPDIDPEIIFKFQRIIKSKHSKGIVAVKGNVCDGCHMILPAQFANEVRASKDNDDNDDKKIVFCPYCSRILFYEELGDEEEGFFHMDDIGSLAFTDESEDEENEDDGDYDDSYDNDSIRELDY